MTATATGLAPVLGVVLLFACTNARTPPSSEGSAEADSIRLSIQPVEEVGGSSYTGIQESRRLIVRTESGWSELWRELAAGIIPPPEAPAVDFEERMVIVAAMGQQRTGGYSISIEEVHATADSLYVTVVEIAPGPGCLTTQALTAPVTAVTVERRDEEAVFLDRQETVDC